MMKVIETAIPGVLVLEPQVFSDARGHFLEIYNQRTFAELGIGERFVQDNQSHSKKGVVRGLHYQSEQAQGKLVRVLHGEIFDVAVDLRRDSMTFGKWVGERLSAVNKKMIWIPKGFAHGFLTLSETADVSYKVTDFWAPQFERTLLWNDPEVGIAWPLDGEAILSDKDRAGHSLKELEKTSGAVKPQR
jgi:dTDP-4-dehydrorhamnose 3,5-epimerase